MTFRLPRLGSNLNVKQVTLITAIILVFAVCAWLIGATALVGLALLIAMWWRLPGADIRAWVPLVLMLGPSTAYLLQCALSRTTEFAADRQAVSLTGDPEGLVSARTKIDWASRRMWERLFGVRVEMMVPTLLQSRPKTEERLARLRTMRVR